MGFQKNDIKVDQRKSIFSNGRFLGELTLKCFLFIFSKLNARNVCLQKLKQFENDKIINDVRYYDISPLKEFDASNRLGNTKFISIEKECFKELPNLEILFFNHNNLAKIVSNSFQNLKKLKKLESEHN